MVPAQLPPRMAAECPAKTNWLWLDFKDAMSPPLQESLPGN